MRSIARSAEDFFQMTLAVHQLVVHTHPIGSSEKHVSGIGASRCSRMELTRVLVVLPRREGYCDKNETMLEIDVEKHTVQGPYSKSFRS
jgi:hypothetical protein